MRRSLRQERTLRIAPQTPQVCDGAQAPDHLAEGVQFLNTGGAGASGSAGGQNRLGEEGEGEGEGQQFCRRAELLAGGGGVNSRFCRQTEDKTLVLTLLPVCESIG